MCLTEHQDQEVVKFVEINYPIIDEKKHVFFAKNLKMAGINKHFEALRNCMNVNIFCGTLVLKKQIRTSSTCFPMR